VKINKRLAAAVDESIDSRALVLSFEGGEIAGKGPEIPHDSTLKMQM
jgi:hypothetical protein